MSIVKIYMNRLLCSLLLIIFASSCSAQDTAPTDQLIKGPFYITTEWQKFPLDKPLKVIPHIQTLEVLLNINQYNFFDNPEELNTKYSIMSDRFKRVSDGKITQPEIILIDSKNREYRTVFHTIGTAFTKEGDFKSLGFGTNVEIRKFYYPKDAIFHSIKIRANTQMTIDNFRWIARYFNRAPNYTWDDISASEIATLE